MPELEDLVAFIVRNKDVRDEARRSLPPELFADTPNERAFRLLISTFYRLMEKTYTNGEVPYRALMHELGIWFAQRRRPGRSDDEDRDRDLRIQIFATPDDVDGEQLTETGLLWKIYWERSQDDFDLTLGFGLLKKFLKERVVFDGLRKLTMSATGGATANFEHHVVELNRVLQEIEAIGAASARPIAVEWTAHQSRLEPHRGRSLIGLRTGLGPLDEKTLGLRGFTVLGAMPNVGKTALATQIALGVCQNHDDAVVVFVSLDMDRFELYRRVHCHLARIDWSTLMFGSIERRGQSEGPYFNNGHQRELEEADGLILEGEVGRRLSIIDRELMGPHVTAARLLSLLAQAKARVGASRALLVLDYIQLINPTEEIAKRGELEVDRFRVQLLQDVIAATRTDANPSGDTVFAISEMRKPSQTKEFWGSQLADLQGSSRLAYAADAVLRYRRMTPDDLKKYYPSLPGGSVDQVAAHLKSLEEQRVSPVVLTLDKARDGMTKGDMALEFEYGRSTFRVLQPDSAASTLRESHAGTDRARRSRNPASA